MESYTWTHQCCSTSKNFHSWVLCWHKMSSRGPTKMDDDRESKGIHIVGTHWWWCSIYRCVCNFVQIKRYWTISFWKIGEPPAVVCILSNFFIYSAKGLLPVWYSTLNQPCVTFQPGGEPNKYNLQYFVSYKKFLPMGR